MSPLFETEKKYDFNCFRYLYMTVSWVVPAAAFGVLLSSRVKLYNILTLKCFSNESEVNLLLPCLVNADSVHETLNSN